MGDFKRSSEEGEWSFPHCREGSLLEVLAAPRNLDDNPRVNLAVGQKMAPAASTTVTSPSLPLPPPPLIDDGATAAAVDADGGRVDGTSEKGERARKERRECGESKWTTRRKDEASTMVGYKVLGRSQRMLRSLR